MALSILGNFQTMRTRIINGDSDEENFAITRSSPYLRRSEKLGQSYENQGLVDHAQVKTQNTNSFHEKREYIHTLWQYFHSWEELERIFLDEMFHFEWKISLSKKKYQIGNVIDTDCDLEERALQFRLKNTGRAIPKRFFHENAFIKTFWGIPKHFFWDDFANALG